MFLNRTRRTHYVSPTRSVGLLEVFAAKIWVLDESSTVAFCDAEDPPRKRSMT